MIPTVRKSGLIIMTDGMPGSGPTPSSEILGVPPKPKDCRCNVCGEYFRSIHNIAEIICEQCKAKAAEDEYRAGCTCELCAARRKETGDPLPHIPNGNLPRGVARVTKRAEAVQGMAPRRKVHGEFNDKALERR